MRSLVGRALCVAAPSLIGPLILLLVGLPQPGIAARPPAELREAVILRIPVGSGPASISNLECTGREPHCAAGLAFLSPNDSLYFYDLVNDNLKVIALRPLGKLARLIPGLGAKLGAGEMPLAGIAAADGSLRLLVGTRGSHARPALWTLARGSVEWRRTPASEALEASATLTTPPPVMLPGMPEGAVTLGRDGAGNSFVEIRRSWSTQVLAKYGSDGRLLAEVTLPERPIWKPLVGWTDKWVTSRGEVVEIYVGPRWLVVSSWAEGS